jgi:methylated-DNA-[protein]-cysteine S-methyltransferase
MTTTLQTATIDSPPGAIRLAAVDGKVVALAYDDHWDWMLGRLVARFGPVDEVETPDPAGAVSALEQYLDGRLDALEPLEVDLGGTPFQAKVWAALRRIPAGETWSYGQLAAAVGSPHGHRAVGSANGKNPVSLIVPCHRVIQSNGALGGYGGGLPRKVWLLRHEGARFRA